MNHQAPTGNTLSSRTKRSIARKCDAGSRYRYGRRRAEGEDGLEAASESFRLFIADWCQIWLFCGYRSCSRAGRCRREGAPCFDRETEFICRQLLLTQPFATLHDTATEIDEEAELKDEFDDDDEE